MVNVERSVGRIYYEGFSAAVNYLENDERDGPPRSIYKFRSPRVVAVNYTFPTTTRIIL